MGALCCLSAGALEILPDGTVCLALRRPWRDGTCGILFSPVELIEKLAALIPKPRINLLLYHGAFAPHARIRRDAVASARAATASEAMPAAPGGCRAAAPRGAGCAGTAEAAPIDPPQGAAPGPGATPSEAVPPDTPGASPTTSDPGGAAPPSAEPRVRPRRYPHPSWAELLRRAWSIDVLACRSCGGRLRLVATIQDPAVVRRILSHLGLPTEVPQPLPARAPPEPRGQAVFPDY